MSDVYSRQLSDDLLRPLLETSWRRGLRLVTEDGRAVRVDDVPLGGLVTVFPEGHTGAADEYRRSERPAPRTVGERERRKQHGHNQWAETLHDDVGPQLSWSPDVMRSAPVANNRVEAVQKAEMDHDS